jgi:hypothetical protein
VSDLVYILTADEEALVVVPRKVGLLPHVRVEDRAECGVGESGSRLASYLGTFKVGLPMDHGLSCLSWGHGHEAT